VLQIQSDTSVVADPRNGLCVVRMAGRQSWLRRVSSCICGLNLPGLLPELIKRTLGTVNIRYFSSFSYCHRSNMVLSCLV
jgi:hypothetical protein